MLTIAAVCFKRWRNESPKLYNCLGSENYPHMTSEDIKTIEGKLDVMLPHPFVEAALSGAFKDPLHDDPGSIVGINMSLRSGDFGDENWNPNLVAFGHDGGGNYFCIDVQNIDAGVFLRDHETLETTKEHESFSRFIQEWT